MILNTIQTHSNWIRSKKEVGDHVIESPDFIKAAEEEIAEVWENLQIA
jgi:hypothetical protein